MYDIAYVWIHNRQPLQKPLESISAASIHHSCGMLSLYCAYNRLRAVSILRHTCCLGWFQTLLSTVPGFSAPCFPLTNHLQKGLGLHEGSRYKPDCVKLFLQGSGFILHPVREASWSEDWKGHYSHQRATQTPPFNTGDIEKDPLCVYVRAVCYRPIEVDGNGRGPSVCTSAIDISSFTLIFVYTNILYYILQ